MHFLLLVVVALLIAWAVETVVTLTVFAVVALRGRRRRRRGR